MRRLILMALFAIFTIGLFGQNTNGTGTGWDNARKKMNFKDSTYYYYAPVYRAGQTLDPDDYYVPLSVDSLHVTASDTIEASWAGKNVYVYAAASIRITFPSGLSNMVGKTINFFQMGAGKIVFIANGTAFVSVLDSVATNQKGNVAGLTIFATNRGMLYGNLTD